MDNVGRIYEAETHDCPSVTIDIGENLNQTCVAKMARDTDSLFCPRGQGLYRPVPALSNARLKRSKFPRPNQGRVARDSADVWRGKTLVPQAVHEENKFLSQSFANCSPTPRRKFSVDSGTPCRCRSNALWPLFTRRRELETRLSSESGTKSDEGSKKILADKR